MTGIRKYLDIKSLLFFISIICLVLYDNTTKTYLVTTSCGLFILMSSKSLLQYKPSLPSMLFIGFTLWAAFSLIWCVNFNIASVRLGTCFILCVFLISIECLEYNNVENIIENSLLVYLIASLLLCFITYQDIKNASFLLMIGATERVGGDNLNTNMLGKYYAIGSVISLYFYFEKKWKPIIIAYLLFAIFVILTRSRSAFLSLIIGSVSYLFYHYWTKNQMRLFWRTMVIAIIAIIGLSKLTIWGDAFYRLEALFDFFSGEHSYTTDASTSMRETLLLTGLKAIPESPILGTGIGTSPSVVASKLGANYEGGDYFHNNYIQLLVETGIVGFSLFYLSIFYIIKQLWRNKEKSPLAVVLLAVLVIFLFCDTNNTTYYHKVYVMFIGISILFIKKSQNQIL